MVYPSLAEGGPVEEILSLSALTERLYSLFEINPENGYDFIPRQSMAAQAYAP